MSTQNYVVLNTSQRDAAMALDATEFEIDPRAVDAASPGAGLNINPDATGFEVGGEVTLPSKYVAPVRIVNDPAYVSACPDLITYLNSLPWCVLENETIFAPPEP